VTKRSKFEYIREDKSLKMWHDNLYLRSSNTARVYLPTMELCCELNSTTPSQILENSKKKDLDGNFTLFVRELESKNKKGSYIVRFKKVLSSWLKFHVKVINFKVNIKKVDRKFDHNE
jgi:hypothetical protein